MFMWYERVYDVVWKWVVQKDVGMKNPVYGFTVQLIYEVSSTVIPGANIIMQRK